MLRQRASTSWKHLLLTRNLIMLSIGERTYCFVCEKTGKKSVGTIIGVVGETYLLKHDSGFIETIHKDVAVEEKN